MSSSISTIISPSKQTSLDNKLSISKPKNIFERIRTFLPQINDANIKLIKEQNDKSSTSYRNDFAYIEKLKGEEDLDSDDSENEETSDTSTDEEDNRENEDTNNNITIKASF